MSRSRSALRREAYKYIAERLNKLSAGSCDRDPLPSIPLNEIRLLKNGLADPSRALVASIKQLLKGNVNEAEIEAYLVKPFEKYQD
jgi:hypothetical protein